MSDSRAMLYPLMLGVVTKVYDDIVDVGFKIPDNHISSLQSIIVSLFTLTAFGDFYFSLSCFIVSSFNSGFDNPFWKSFFPLCMLLTIINIPYAGRFMLLKIVLVLLAVAIILLFAYAEELLFPEEVSLVKIVFRSLLIIGFAFASLILSFGFLPIPTFIVQPLLKTTMLLFTNMIVSVGNMTYLWYHEKMEDKGADAELCLETILVELRKKVEIVRGWLRSWLVTFVAAP